MRMHTPPAFAQLLRRYRLAAGLTQEALAARANLSVRAVSDLERGVKRHPHWETVALLTQALGLTEAERADFAGAARQAVLLPTTMPAQGQAPQTGPVRALDIQPGQTKSTNLPRVLTSFIGRTREQVTVARLLQEAPLLTLTGAGGCGKTRLAIEVARAVVAAYPDGVCLVELAPLADPTLVAQAVATALGVPEEPGHPWLSLLAAALQEKHLLLVLDNCEHLVGACAELAGTLLQSCPQLQVLATSREPLRMAGEQVWRVPSLSLPDPRQPAPAWHLHDAEAVRLFVERARAVQPAFALTEQNAAAALQVCRRLDGIPLALELAAARLAVLTLEGLAARLDDCFRLLTGGSRTALPRQQTLRATMDWSYALLAEAERALLRRLAVFAGGWTLEAAEAVCAGQGLDAWLVLDMLAGLVNKSLVVLEEPKAAAGGEGRYRLLETVRQYAQELLVASGETAMVRERHLAWCLALAEEAEPALLGAGQRGWLERLETERDNLRAALQWTGESSEVALGLRLASALGRSWELRGHWSEGRGWLEGLLAPVRSGAGVAASVQAKAAHWAGILAWNQGDLGRATALFEESQALYETIGDSRGSAEALHCLGTTAQFQGDYERAVPLLQAGLALRRNLGDTGGIAESLNLLGRLAVWQGDLRRAVALLTESLALYQELGDKHGISAALRDLGNAANDTGDYPRAVALQTESLALAREIEHRAGISVSRGYLAKAAREQGDQERAGALLAECLASARSTGSKWGVAGWLCELALVANYQGDHEQAEALSTESLALFRALESSRGMALALSTLGAAAHGQGDLDRAAQCYREGLALRRSGGEKRSIAASLEGLAVVATAAGRWQHAARLLGAAEALREAIRAPLPPVDRAEHARAVGEARTMLGDDVFQAAWDAGRALSLEQAIAEA
jgi:non-specific serine/threonine protein kinase